MSLLVSHTSTQTAVISTEHTLATTTEQGVYVLVVDLSNLVNGDTVELRLKTRVLDTSTAREAYKSTHSHVQAQPNIYSVPVPVRHYLTVTLKQVAGTGRAFDWELLRM